MSFEAAGLHSDPKIPCKNMGILRRRNQIMFVSRLAPPVSPLAISIRRAEDGAASALLCESFSTYRGKHYKIVPSIKILISIPSSLVFFGTTHRRREGARRRPCPSHDPGRE